MVQAETEILALAVAAHGRAEGALPGAAGMVALDAGRYRLGLGGTLHPDGIEQTRVEVHVRTIMGELRRPAKPASRENLPAWFGRAGAGLERMR